MGHTAQGGSDQKLENSKLNLQLSSELLWMNKFNLTKVITVVFWENEKKDILSITQTGGMEAEICNATADSKFLMFA